MKAGPPIKIYEGGPVAWSSWCSTIMQNNPTQFQEYIKKTYGHFIIQIEIIEMNRTTCPLTNLVFYIVVLRSLASLLALNAL
jgi:hypothetical protein